MKRVGAKGSGRMMTITWEEALEEICDKFTKIEREYGSEAIWPYYYAGTMGLVMRDGINRLRHEKEILGGTSNNMHESSIQWLYGRSWENVRRGPNRDQRIR